MKSGKFSEEQVLKLAAKRDFRVSRFAWSHDGLRKLTRRMCKDGKLRMVQQDSDGFTYRTAEPSASRTDAGS